MRTYTQTFNGNQRFNTPGQLFRLLSTVNPVKVEAFVGGAAVSVAEDVEAGFYFTEKPCFDSVAITTKTMEQVKFLIGESEAGLDRSVGTVSIDNMAGAFVQSAKTVINVDGQLLAANPARRYLLIQNNDLSGVIYLRLDGGIATPGTGIKIAAGGSYECQGYVPAGEIRAIGSIASNPNVIVVEG